MADASAGQRKSAGGPDTALDDIRREVIESRNLVIKTDNLLKNLHAELKLVGKRQDDFEKRQWISSGVAYVLFAALAVGASWLVTTSRSVNAAKERERLEKQVGELSTDLERARTEAAAQALAERAAHEAYRQMTTLQGEDRLQGVAAVSKLDVARLSELEKQALADRAGLIRSEVGQAVLERAKAAYKRGDYRAVTEDMTRFLSQGMSGQDAPDASFYLGASLVQLKRYEEAVPHLERFVQQEQKSRVHDQGMLLLALSLDQLNQHEKAAEVARDGLNQHPSSPYASQLRSRLNSARRALGLSTGTPAATPAPAPAPESPPASTPPATPPAAPTEAAKPPPAAPKPAPKPAAPAATPLPGTQSGPPQ